MRRALFATLLVAFALAGCGRLNRAVTITRPTQTSGAAAAATLQQHLANEFPNARVTCSHSLIVNVGTRTSCTITEAGTNRSVSFTFTSSHGAIDPASVKTS